MPVHFDYPSIRDFFEVYGNTSCEKLNDYEHCRAESDRLYNEQLKKSEKDIPAADQEKTDSSST